MSDGVLEFNGEDWRASRMALREALQGMVIDEIDLDPGEFDTNASIITLRAFAMHGTKPSVQITLSAMNAGLDSYPRVELKVEPWFREAVRGAGIGGKELLAAVESLMRSLPREAFHYGVLLTKLEEGGIKVGGVDPSATLLTALGRSEIIEGLGNRSGMYRLKEDT